MTYDLFLLALTVWREARNQSQQAKLGVAWSIMNRVHKPGWWGHNLFQVLTLHAQYTSMTVSGDPNLVQYPPPADANWLQCIDTAKAAIEGTQPCPVGEATHYYDCSIAPPTWTLAAGSEHIVDIGAFRFWRVA